MAGTLTPTPFQTVLDTDGVAVSDALIYTYVGGTTTAAATYTTAALTVANANPIVADSAGRFVAYLPAGGNFKFLYKTSAGATIKEQDNILSVPGAAVNLDIEGTVGQAVTAGQVCYLSSGTEATPLTAGLWYLTDADAAATSTLPQAIGVAVSGIAINTSGTIRLAGLVTTASAVVTGTTYYVSATAGAITATAPVLSRQVGVAMTTSSLLMAATTAIVSALPNPIEQDLLFTDATYDIGKSGASRPRDLFQSRNATIGGTLDVVGATTLSSTLGVTGAVTTSSTLAVGTGLTYTTSVKSTTALATPGALSATQATAFASTVSGAAIMGFGTTNDVSLMNRAGTVVLGVGPNTTTVNMTGLLTVSGFGTHAFSASGTGGNRLRITNTATGTGDSAEVSVFAGTTQGYIYALNQSYTTSGPDVQAGVVLYASGAGGMSIQSGHASGAIRFYTGGSTERVKIDSNGAMTKAAQPAFFALGAVQSNVTGDGTLYTMVFGTEVYDQANNFSTSTFTAPVTGRYLLTTIIGFQGVLAGHDAAYIQIVTSNRTMTVYHQNVGVRLANDTTALQMNTFADMDSGDTAVIKFSVSGSTKVIDTLLDVASFSGALIC